MSGRDTFRQPGRYVRWLSLASHEFFHTWNIRRLRPKALVEYDYENEVYTPSLWVGEGVTSYYQDLLLARADFLSKTQMLSSISGNIGSTERAVGRKKQSLRQSSFDSWIKFYRPDENSPNTTISYYSKGAVVAFLLDAKLRELTDGEKSLDDLMRTLYERHVESGYLPSDLRAIASELAGEDLSDWFRSTVDRTDELDYEPMLDWFGLEFAGQPRTRRGAGQAQTTRPQPWLGFRTSDSVVTSVTADSPATAVGINIGDEILGVDGQRVTNIASVLFNYDVGDDLEMLMARKRKIMTVHIEVGSRPEVFTRLRFQNRPTRDQTRRVDEWLGLVARPKKSTEDEESKDDEKNSVDDLSKLLKDIDE